MSLYLHSTAGNWALALITSYLVESPDTLLLWANKIPEVLQCWEMKMQASARQISWTEVLSTATATPSCCSAVWFGKDFHPPLMLSIDGAAKSPLSGKICGMESHFSEELKWEKLHPTVYAKPRPAGAEASLRIPGRKTYWSHVMGNRYTHWQNTYGLPHTQHRREDGSNHTQLSTCSLPHYGQRKILQKLTHSKS